MKRILLVVALCTVAALAFGEDKKPENKRAASTIVLDETGVKNLRIESVQVEETDFEAVVFSLGRIEAIPSKTAAVSSRVSGRIMELKANVGDQVQPGQEVARLESRQPGDPPPSIMLKAPIAGLITKVDARQGDPLDPDKALLEITDLTEVHAVARVPEHKVGGMKPGTVAHIKVAALPNEKFDGELLRFGASVDRESGTIDAIFRLINPEGLLRPGMCAEFSIVMSQRSGVVSVPRAALQGEASNRFVYVKDFDLPNTFVKTSVLVGEINDRFAEITNGLLPGDEVVTRGAYSLSFAGANSVSLKEALDAAHGHEHAEDGGELTPEKQAEMAAAKRAAAGGAPAQEAAGVSPLWMYASIVLLLVLVVVLFSKRQATAPEEDEVAVKKLKKEIP